MRTYTELQSLHIIDNKRGIGYFVNPGAKKNIVEKKKAEFFDRILPEFIRQASLVGITASDLKKHLEKLK